MTTSIFSFDSYHEVLRHQIDKNESLRGYKTLLAEASGCKTAYFSQVLAERARLSPEQAFGLSQFWKFDKVEREYFLALVDLERSGQPEHRAYLKSKIEEIRLKATSLEKRLNKRSLNEEILGQFFSSPYYAMVQLALTIPGHDSEKPISKRLDLTVEVVSSILHDLEKMQLAERKGTSWRPRFDRVDFHIPADSVHLVTNHIQWRTLVLQYLLKRSRLSEVHYTALNSVSKKDYEKLKVMISEFIASCRKIAVDSKEEELVYMLVDFGLA